MLGFIMKVPLRPLSRPFHAARRMNSTRRSEDSQRLPLPTVCSASLLCRKKNDPLFSIACTLFSIRNSPYPDYFLSPAHSLPKTPGGAGTAASQFRSSRVTPMESISFANVPSNPFRMILFRKSGTGSLPSFLSPASSDWRQVTGVLKSSVHLLSVNLHSVNLG